MRVIRPGEVREEDRKNPLMTGGPVTNQSLIPPEMSNNYNCGLVNFGWGARTKLHTHSSDQILVITSGVGIVATENEEREVSSGDIAFIPMGEKHWHGAKKESYMSHISITIKGSTMAQLED